MAVEITAIRLPTGGTHEHITTFKWKNEDASTGQSSTAQMVEYIDGNGKAHVGSGSQTAPVGVVRPDGHAPYLRSYADGKWNNNLLSLPRF